MNSSRRSEFERLAIQRFVKQYYNEIIEVKSSKTFRLLFTYWLEANLVINSGKVTIQDIAETANVSKSTVSRVLNNTTPVNELKRQAVLGSG